MLELAKERRARGLDTPSFEGGPVLSPDLVPYYEAFSELNAQRSIGFEENPISMADLRAWLELVDMPRVSWPDYHRWVMHLDGVYMRHRRQQRAARAPKGPKK